MNLLSRFYTREDFHQSPEFAKVMEKIGWSSIPIDGHRIVVRQLGPIALAKMQRSLVTDMRKINLLRSKLHIVRTIIEPACVGTFISTTGKKHSYSFTTPTASRAAIALFRDAGYRMTSEHYAHTKTALLDLSQGIPALVEKMPSKTRYNIKVSTRPINDYNVTRFDRVTKNERDSFFNLHTRWSSEKKIYGFSNNFLEKVLECFPTTGWFITAKTNGSFSGGMLVLIHDRIAYYFYTCTSESGKKHHVPTGLLYQALQLAVQKGADIFDFCSIYDERYPKEHPRWKGFSEFKSRFCPTKVYYPPSFSRWI